jgi:TonB family protein
MTTLILSAALKGTLLLASAWFATAMLRRSSADLRHRVWLAALCGLPLLMIPLPVPEAARVDVVYTFSAESTAVSGVNSIPLWSMIWAVGAAIFLLRFLVGVARLSRITRNSRATSMPGIRTSAAISTPLTWGIFNPSILLPEYASDWSAEKRSVAVAHERTHISRGDWFWQSYAQLVNAIFWFHPLVWLASSRLRTEAEEAVDDAVVSSGAEAASYAEQLVEVARHISSPTQAAAVAMVRYPALSQRVTAILDNTRIRTLAGVRSRVAIAAVALCSIPVLAAFQSRTPRPVSVPAPRLVEQAVPQPRPVVKKAFPRLVAQAAPKPVPQPAPAPAPAPRAEPFPIGGGVSAPVAILKPEPVIPQEARESRLEGEVWLGVVIDENGIPTEISVKRSLHPLHDASAIEAVEKWRFKPGMKDGHPVAVRATIAVTFNFR